MLTDTQAEEAQRSFLRNSSATYREQCDTLLTDVMPPTVTLREELAGLNAMSHPSDWHKALRAAIVRKLAGL